MFLAKGKFLFLLFVAGIVFLIACKKETTLVPDNDPPYYNEVNDVLIDNYINRTFIDLIGREPLDTEMLSERNTLKAADLSFDARAALVVKLMTDTAWIEGDTSYMNAYYHRFYEITKVRLLEGASKSEIQQEMGPLQFAITLDSINGNTFGMEVKKQIVEKLKNLLRAEKDYLNGVIDVKQFNARMVDNAIYDKINMNTFNFVNASFDNLLWRYPTQAEFLIGYDMIEDNVSGILFGQPGQNKEDYARIMTESREFHEGMIIWAYSTLLAREPSTIEKDKLMQDFYNTGNFHEVLKSIIITDEYAHFD